MPSASRDRRQHRHFDTLGHDGVRVVEIASVVGTDEHVDVCSQCACFVAHSATDGRVNLRELIEHGANGCWRREIDFDLRCAASVLAQRRSQPDDDLQRRTAVFTQSTGGR
jgi:hypothetical protein